MIFLPLPRSIGKFPYGSVGYPRLVCALSSSHASPSPCTWSPNPPCQPLNDPKDVSTPTAPARPFSSGRITVHTRHISSSISLASLPRPQISSPIPHLRLSPAQTPYAKPRGNMGDRKGEMMETHEKPHRSPQTRRAEAVEPRSGIDLLDGVRAFVEGFAVRGGAGHREVGGRRGGRRLRAMVRRLVGTG